jgi:hypothetical protein
MGRPRSTADPGKFERLRCLRYGAMIRLFRHRYGTKLPNDDAGKEDIWVLVQNVSTAINEPEKKMRHAIELWAPWMPQDQAEAMMAFAMRLPRFERCPTSEELGERLCVTNDVRNKLKLWPFKPTDISDEELAAQRKARTAERRRERARLRGVVSRAEYLVSVRKPKLWEAEGISRRTWYRRRKSVARGSAQIIVLKGERNPVPRSAGGESASGFQIGAGAEGRGIQVSEASEAESYRAGSHDAEPNPVPRRTNEGRTG